MRAHLLLLPLILPGFGFAPAPPPRAPEVKGRLEPKGRHWAYRTTNFEVTADAPEVAARVGREAERQRWALARLWLGKELPPWKVPCPVDVRPSTGLGGYTAMVFDEGQVLDMNVHVEGPVERVLSAALPHEITHTVFASHFRRPWPRWAETGAGVLAEPKDEQRRHERLARQILMTPEQAVPLRRLFELREYPRDVMVVYAEGHSVTAFLVAQKGHRAFLAFVGDGMDGAWDAAVRKHYGYADVEALEEAWLGKVLGRAPDGLRERAAKAPPEPAPFPAVPFPGPAPKEE